jgi:uncharacterized protein (DUF983 family)
VRDAVAARRQSWLRSLGHALRGRCPSCGEGRVLASWFRVHERCAGCGLRFERGREDEQDYWLGAYTLNFLVTEVVFGVGLLLVLLLTWPEPPWRLLLFGGGALMVLAPIAFYPVSKLLWLAIDLAVRPPQPEDFD